MNEWQVDYDNDTSPDDDCFVEWWNVSSEVTGVSFKGATEEDANWLCSKLNCDQSESETPSIREILTEAFDKVKLHYGISLDTANFESVRTSDPSENNVADLSLISFRASTIQR